MMISTTSQPQHDLQPSTAGHVTMTFALIGKSLDFADRYRIVSRRASNPLNWRILDGRRVCELSRRELFQAITGSPITDEDVNEISAELT